MNKFAIIGIVLVLILGGGFIYSKATDTDNCTADLGKDVVMTVTSKKHEWKFEPETINVGKCDRVDLTVVNEDNFDHGVAIDAFGISQRLPANATINIKFVASKEGEFPFYCSVSCSDSKNSSFGLAEGKIQTGTYAGTFRGHFEHIGKFIVSLAAQIVN
jgi:heme/copper-type cytochrome/quinol oxidase subunit 2